MRACLKLSEESGPGHDGTCYRTQCARPTTPIPRPAAVPALSGHGPLERQCLPGPAEQIGKDAWPGQRPNTSPVAGPAPPAFWSAVSHAKAVPWTMSSGTRALASRVAALAKNSRAVTRPQQQRLIRDRCPGLLCEHAPPSRDHAAWVKTPAAYCRTKRIAWLFDRPLISAPGTKRSWGLARRKFCVSGMFAACLRRSAAPVWRSLADINLKAWIGFPECQLGSNNHIQFRGSGAKKCPTPFREWQL